ncbi:MAG: inositol monophosphatase family protein [Desulfurococcaceae archaeon]
MINNKETCRVFKEIVERDVKFLRENYGREEYNEVIGLGVSGDVTRKIDILSENLIEEEIRSRGIRAWLVGEERGLRKISEEPEVIVLVDPLDGSLNYAHKIPFASMSVAVYPRNVNNPVNLAYGIVYNIFTGDTIELCENRVYYNGSEIAGYLNKGLELLSIYTENPRHIELARKVFSESKLNLKTRTLGSASIEAAYAAIGFIGGFMHLTGGLRNSDVAVALAIATRLGTPVYAKPDLHDLRIDTIQKINKIVIASPHNPVWRILEKL